MSNPEVRQRLHFYPEDTGKHISEARQAAHWLDELPLEEKTPMVRVKKDDYYIFEPTMLTDGTTCVPFRWFTRNGNFVARAWLLEAVGETGWIVHQDVELDVQESRLLKNFPNFIKDHKNYGVSHPSHIRIFQRLRHR